MGCRTPGPQKIWAFIQAQLRNWVKALADDPEHSFPGPGQMKPEQSEIARLKREVAKLKAERDILKNCPGRLPACAQ